MTFETIPVGRSFVNARGTILRLEAKGRDAMPWKQKTAAPDWMKLVNVQTGTILHWTWGQFRTWFSGGAMLPDPLGLPALPGPRSSPATLALPVRDAPSVHTDDVLTDEDLSLPELGDLDDSLEEEEDLLEEDEEDDEDLTLPSIDGSDHDAAPEDAPDPEPEPERQTRRQPDSDGSQVVDGVRFDNPAMTLFLLNGMSRERFIEVGVGGAPASILAAGKPWTNLQSISDTAGIGTKTLEVLAHLT